MADEATLKKFHPKLLDRLATIYLKKLKDEGQKGADEYAERTFTLELIREIRPFIQKKMSK